MARCEMQRWATSGELTDLYFELRQMTPEEREAKVFALFVAGRGILNGKEALEYLEDVLK